ncbi:MAG: NAD(P)/FAD-dependent oxidoreductase [Pleurocapsa sp.]
MKNSSCIVVGGGITGLITATVLQRRGIKVTVLDKGRGIGGRLATRRVRQGESIEGVFDYGTQYFSVKQPQFQTWVDEWLQQGVVKEWCRGFGEVDGQPRYFGVNGTRSIAKHLAQNLDVHTSTRVVKVSYDNQWLIETENQQYQGDVLVMTPPVPQSLALLDAAKMVLPTKIRSSLEQVSYHSCIAVLALLEQPSQIPAPGGIACEDLALVWLADNYQKGISPNGYAVTLHATPEFSETHWDSDDAEIAEQLFAAASDYLGSPVIKYQIHRWRYSLPKTFYSQPCLALSELSLVMAGDAFVKPKIEGAALSGIAAGESIINQQLVEKNY